MTVSILTYVEVRPWGCSMGDTAYDGDAVHSNGRGCELASVDSVGNRPLRSTISRFNLSAYDLNRAGETIRHRRRVASIMSYGRHERGVHCKCSVVPEPGPRDAGTWL